LEKFVLDLIHVSGNHFKHKVVCLERVGALSPSDSSLDIKCLGMNQGLQLKPIFEICSIIKNFHIDLVHTHNEKAQFYGALAGFFCGIPVVHTKHGKNQITFRSRLRNNLLARFCTRIIAVSRDAASQCINEERISASKVSTILNGVDTDVFFPNKETSSLRTSLGISAGIPVVGVIARLAAVKDHATLISACQILKASGIDFRLLIIGDGPLKAPLVGLANSLELHRTIIFAGSRFDIPDLLNVMDIFVLSSISEGISLTLIEAMACGLPVVATNVGGNPEVVVDGVTGYLVPPKEPEAIADKLLLLLNNARVRKSFGSAGRTRAVENFSIQKAVYEYETCYRAIIG